MKIAYQGRPGAHGELAVRVLPQAEAIACETFEAVIRAVERGICVYGVLPIHNTFAGVIERNIQLIAASSLKVVGDVRLPVTHALIGLPGARLDTLRSALSHPVALAQCRRFFKRHPSLNAIAHFDTAGAVEYIVRTGDPTLGAIAAIRAAEIYGAQVLVTDVGDPGSNRTLFVVLSRSQSS